MNFTEGVWFVLGCLLVCLILLVGPEQQFKGNGVIFSSTLSPETRNFVQVIIWIITVAYLTLSLYA
jgi:hypothetical protein